MVISVENSQDYFGKAMGNFIHEMSGAGAIRHMVDQGYSIRQIMERLDYPTPQRRVEETALKHMLKQGILLERLPDQKMTAENQTKQKTVSEYRQIKIPASWDRRQLSEAVYVRKEQDGEDFSYVLLPIAGLKKDRELLSCLSDRERDYLCGLPWEGVMVYHRLTGRMYEIAIELSMAIGTRMQGSGDKGIEYPDLNEIKFYFLKSREEVSFANI